MDSIAALAEKLTPSLGPLGPVIIVAALGFILILLALYSMMQRRPDPLDRLRQSNLAERAARPRAQTPGQRLRVDGGKDKLQKFAEFLEPKTEQEMSASLLKMTRAGYRSKNAVRIFHAAQFVLGIGMLTLGVVYTLIASTRGEVTTSNMVIAVLLPGVIGYYLPTYWVERRVQTRHQDIQNGFPDALDMLLVCVEAGQSLDQGIIRVAKELATGYPAMAEEFALIAYELKAGKDKAQVLRGFGDRTGVPDVQSFVTVMIQSQAFGTSIAEALRVYSADMRDKRVMRAEEAANKIPTKMTLGTMMFTVPPLLIILVGPSVHDMMETFATMNIAL
ncbi:pilus assembly protein TadC [Rhodobacter veldkampii DSM 11550]|uniref:Pilus assembly protein TadC n=1 Tax=Phaeovulum veldkampii DSM 11550 TaxID=1185920 RepID=A0A2T4JMG2_9RHOB|nr:type II secretion system F family protein [Phaeovulum veldkampii]MBK5945353.1 pilus assembly protein TadC [Phaeovulum veldkampii DSM 11550]NCU20887.1 type II secretion system F family protein [Candidatus Falkowbacteria bacterium]PTE19095.1 pilus assembly protein TadC [Phaeovulum veldkampii DSM 11550]TDQ61348.1 tight adherence protein C [Phaeovulum veldkampii DSM 11550]